MSLRDGELIHHLNIRVNGIEGLWGYLAENCEMMGQQLMCLKAIFR